MPQSIKKITLNKFRKFQNNTLEATDRNILVGANNCGKTSILHALRLFFFAVANEFSGNSGSIKFHKRYINTTEILPVADSIELWTNKNKGHTKQSGINIEVEFQSGLTINAIFTFRFGQVHVDAEINNSKLLTATQVNNIINHRIAFIPGLVGILSQEAYVTPARRSAMSIEARYTEMYRSSLLHLDQTDKKSINRINKALKEHLGIIISNIKFDPEKDVYVDIEYDQDGVLLDLSNSGSGMLQVIQLLVYTYLYKPSLLLIDEPDAHLHPELQQKVGLMIRDVAKDLGAQLFLATHSPEIIDSYGQDEIYFIESSKKRLLSIKQDNIFVDKLLDAGIITKSSLSRIAVQPKCLVVEDKKIKILEKIDSLLNTKLFSTKGEYRRAEGVSKFTAIQEVYLTVQDVIGKKIKLFFIQDKDGLPDKYIKYIKQKYRANNIDASFLDRHEIENYILDAKIIRAALNNENIQINLSDVRKLLIEAAEKIKSNARGDIRRKCKQVNSFCGRPDGLSDEKVEADVDQWFDSLRLNEKTILEIFPGKELLAEVRLLIDDKYKVDLRDTDLLNSLSKSRLASDIQVTFTSIVAAKSTSKLSRE